MSFFDKLKDGASKAADKAKESVEIAKLYTQISSKKRGIEGEYQEMGRSIYAAYNGGHLESAGSLVSEHCEKIRFLEQEIKQLENKIKLIKNEKQCASGHVVPLNTKFCPTCGYKFEEEPESILDHESGSEIIQAEIQSLPLSETTQCPSCSAEIEIDDRRCVSCGQELINPS